MQVVLQVRADLRAVALHRDPVALQLRGGAKARNLQDLRAADGACAQDHRAALFVFHADGAAPFDQNAARMGVGFHLQPGAFAVRRKAFAVFIRQPPRWLTR